MDSIEDCINKYAKTYEMTMETIDSFIGDNEELTMSFINMVEDFLNSAEENGSFYTSFFKLVYKDLGFLRATSVTSSIAYSYSKISSDLKELVQSGIIEKTGADSSKLDQDFLRKNNCNFGRIKFLVDDRDEWMEMEKRMKKYIEEPNLTMTVFCFICMILPQARDESDFIPFLDIVKKIHKFLISLE